MLHVYEFEVFKGQDGWLLAFPFDFDGGTQGADLAEVSACLLYTSFHVRQATVQE